VGVEEEGFEGVGVDLENVELMVSFRDVIGAVVEGSGSS